MNVERDLEFWATEEDEGWSGVTDKDLLRSIALSLKRIADALDQNKDMPK